MDGKMVNPPSDSVKSSQHSSHHLIIDVRDKKELRLNGELSPDHRCRLVPWRIIGKDLVPERDNLRVIL